MVRRKTNCVDFRSLLNQHGYFSLSIKIRSEPYMQNRKRDTDVQNRLLDSVGEGKGGMFRENSIETSIP